MNDHMHLSPEWEVTEGDAVTDPVLPQSDDWYSDLQGKHSVPRTIELLNKWTADTLHVSS